MICPAENPPRFCLDHDYDHVLLAQEQAALVANHPVVVQRSSVRFRDGRLSAFASDAGFGVGSWPFAVVIADRDGRPMRFEREEIHRDRENDITHTTYRSGAIVLTVWND